VDFQSEKFPTINTLESMLELEIGSLELGPIRILVLELGPALALATGSLE